MRLFTFVLLIICLTFCRREEVFLPHLVSEGMVLQSNDTVVIEGYAHPFAKVNISFLGRQYEVWAGWNKHWQARIPTGDAGGPFVMNINGQIIKDIYIGDVWLLSGQSNMAYSMDSVMDLYREIRDTTIIPAIHHFRVSTWTPIDGPKDDNLGTQWENLSPEAVGDWSAIGYFFARRMYEKSGRPQGIINASQGGSDITGWMSREALNDCMPRYIERLDKWPSDSCTFNAPTGFFNGMIAPMKNWKISGVVWYQGENNVDRPDEYATLLSSLIGSWRRIFWKKLPFIVIQLHDYQDPDTTWFPGWEKIRQSQCSVAQIMPHVTLIETAGLSESENLHPHHKQEVGECVADALLK